MTGILFVHFYQFEFLEHLHAALHLESLRVSALEALDEVLGLGNHFLLFLILLHLLFAAFLAQLQILAVCGLVVVDTPHSNLDGTSGDVVDKLTVVAYYDHRLRAVDDKVLKPTDTLNVEVIGRLIKEQHVRRFEQQLCQLYAHSPSAGKLARGTIKVRAFETKTEKRLLHILLKVSHVYGIKLLRKSRHLLDELHIFVALIVCTCRQFVVDSVNFCLYLMQVGKGLAGFVEDGTSVLCHQVLRQVSHYAVLGNRNRASCGFSYTGYYLEQRALAGAVLAHKCYTVLLVYLEGNILE